MIIRDKYLRRYFIISMVLFFVFFVFANLFRHSDKLSVKKQKFQKEYLLQDSSFNTTGQNILLALQIDSLLSWDDISTLVKDTHTGCYIFRYDSLRYWNKNDVNLQSLEFVKEGTTGIYHFEHGWYYCFLIKKDNWKVVLYKLIQQKYALSNRYLKNEAGDVPSYDNTIGFTDDTLSPKVVTIYSNLGKSVIGLVKNNRASGKNIFTSILFFLWLAGWLFIELFLLKLHRLLLHDVKPAFRLILVFIDVSILALIAGKWFVPAILENTFWFVKWNEIVPYINSRGMTVLLVTMLVVVGLYVYNITKKQHNTQKTNNIELIFVAFIQFIFVFFLLYLFNRFYTLNLRPDDNAIGFLFRRDIIELYYISCIVIALYLFQIILIKKVVVTSGKILLFAMYVLLFTLMSFLFIKGHPLFFVAVFFTQILFSLIIRFTARDSNFIFLRYLLITVLFALSFSVIINDSYAKQKNLFHKQIVRQLVVNRDLTLENRFHAVVQQIRQNKTIKLFIKSNVPDRSVKEYLMKTYFKKLFGNYYMQLTICHDSDLLEVNSSGDLVNCKAYFSNIKNEIGNKIIDSSLVIMNQEAESRYYLGEIYLGNGNKSSSTLYIELFSSIVPSGLGYPELLVDNRNQIDLTGYSIAKFHHKQLVYKVGEYDYHGSYSFMQPWPNDRFFYLNGYVHYKLRLNSSDVLVVSRPVRSYAEQMATFSLLFLLFSFIAVILYVVSTGRKQLGLFKYSFRTRLQFFIMGTLVVLFALMSAISVYYFSDIKKTFIVNQLNEKSKSVLTELQDKFSNENFISKKNKDYIQQQLQKISIIFFTDINVYSHSGELLATSRPRIFNAGLLSTLINPDGYRQIINDQKIFYLTREQIGSMFYYSAYVPLSFGTRQPVAILNLPYFARQSEVARSFLPLIYNYLNIFVLLGILGAFMALIISKILTRPLTMLQRSLSQIRIDKKNEPLKWNNDDDEIGHLIAEYNLMVKKIEESAGLLKRSEREMAWREVAQQVAHEIRNPLTPMKLNLQYLQKVYNESKADFNKTWKSLSASLIDQIEALNEVASAFSDLANNNLSDKVKVDVVQLIKSAIDIYKNNDKVDVIFNSTFSEVYVMARQNELLRVFNNLIKNAVQSIYPDTGKIEISISEKDNRAEILISDNGRGIPEEMKNRIFQPYFTTKSGGTGVGLAIVKSIITEIGGEITFNSKEGEGTQFVVLLKTVK